MGTLQRVLISRQTQGWIGLIVWVLSFSLLVAAFVAVGIKSARDAMWQAGELNLPDVVRLKDNALIAFDLLESNVAAASCTPLFHRQVGAVAFLPDGLNEFLHLDGDRVLCSTSVERFLQPPEFDVPDIASDRGLVMWIDRPLDSLGLVGLRGSIYRRGVFAVVVPGAVHRPLVADWIAAETVLVGRDGRWWRTGGQPGLYRPDGLDGLDWSAFPQDVTLRSLVCDPSGIECIALAGSLRGLAATRVPAVVLAFPFAALVASWLRRWIMDLLARAWSFPARFARTLNRETLVLLYQPLMETATGTIVGCEVLARWRDVDGTIVTPDRFLPEVERLKATLRFTALVVEKAHTDLSAITFARRPFRVGINIFPQDLNAASLLPILQPLLADANRFETILELVESRQIDVVSTAPEIEMLRGAGLKVFIDDFGIGYFSIQTLVDLKVDGVKLDRAFAMAPTGSVLSRMMPLAIEMVQATQRPIVVEGVETAERLAQLRAITPKVEIVQGYYISRPIDAEALERFCAAPTAVLAPAA